MITAQEVTGLNPVEVTSLKALFTGLFLFIDLNNPSFDIAEFELRKYEVKVYDEQSETLLSLSEELEENGNTLITEAVNNLSVTDGVFKERMDFLFLSEEGALAGKRIQPETKISFFEQ